jgi:ribosomal protein S27E
MNTTQEFKFACPACHQHIIYDPEMTGMEIACPSCSQTLVVPNSTRKANTKLMLQGQTRETRPTLPKNVTAFSKTSVLPQPERASMMLPVAAVTAILIVAGMVVIHFSH